LLDVFWGRIKELLTSRLTIITGLIIVLFIILFYQIFVLQIDDATTEDDTSVYLQSDIRDIKSTRGNFYDDSGYLLAYNVLSYSIIMEDSALLTTNASKNEMLYKLTNLLDKFGLTMETDFGIGLNEYGVLQFTVTGSAELRFKKNAYGRTSTSALTEDEKNATAQEVYDFLRYGNENAAMFQISDTYTEEEALKIMALRYQLFSTPSGTQFTLVTDVNDEVVAAIKENSAELPGVEIQQNTSRVYNDSMYFAHIIGYTGSINATEIDENNATIIEENKFTEDDLDSAEAISLLYNSTDVIGKTGMEKTMESYLSGTKGTSMLTVNDSGKIISQTTNTEPVAGNDIYLTIDRDLQIACYHILERNIAAILLDKLVPDMDYGSKGEDAADITTPIYEAYYALISNQIINVEHFEEDDATDLEKSIFEEYDSKRAELISSLNSIMAVDSTTKNTDTSEELQEYLTYMYSEAANLGLLLTSSIDTTDEVYQEYKNNEISMSEFLQHAINKNWVDLSILTSSDEYYSTEEYYTMFIDYLFDKMQDDSDFKNKIYHTLIFSYKLSGKEICLLLFDQNVLKYDEIAISNLRNGRVKAYDFLCDKIQKLEITPGQLGLDPCSGSIVITDVNTGDIKALVTYPSYDNNMLANKIVWDYYSTLISSDSYPLLNRPTSQTTTTGSTFKPLSALIGLGEGVITTSTKILDEGIFEKVFPSPRCWKYPGTHGWMDLTHAIENSCNFFFYEVGYRLSTDSAGNYSDSKGIATIQKYAAMFGLTEKSGIEIAEATPTVSNTDAVRTAIGYYHSFTPTQISRYVTTIANEGTCYNLTLLDSVRDSEGNIIMQNEASIYNEITQFSDAQWAAVKEGMYLVVNSSESSLEPLYSNLGVKVAGKTGTAQVSTSIPNHALFVSFAPYSNPEISVTVVIPNGFKSANAAYIAREVYGLYFFNENKDALLNGDVEAGSVTSITVSD